MMLSTHVQNTCSTNNRMCSTSTRPWLEKARTKTDTEHEERRKKRVIAHTHTRTRTRSGTQNTRGGVIAHTARNTARYEHVTKCTADKLMLLLAICASSNSLTQLIYYNVYLCTHINKHHTLYNSKPRSVKNIIMHVCINTVLPIHELYRSKCTTNINRRIPDACTCIIS